ncbi:MAG TPA: conjugal transfer protein TraH, partial [Streptosporangiaceae bacterium]|nr:conjugal transfer protein TraH [Streptosporangiaceae bacterium]
MGVMVLCVCRPAVAALSAPEAFSGLLSSAHVTGPGYYTSATRGVFMGGSTNLYIPNDTADLISISPPTESAGCGGISLFFGGFSFINGAQLEQLVTQVMQNALGYALQLGIRVLCPMCSDILGELQKLAADAAKASRSSCQLAAGLVDSAASHARLGAFTGGTSDACSDLSASQGMSTDYMDAMTSDCQGVQTASTWINTNITTLFASSPDQGSQAAAKQAAQQGNPLWAQLTLAGYGDTYVKEIFISMEGFTSNVQVPGESKPSLHSYPGWNSPDAGKILLDILLYGANPDATKAALPAGAAVSAGLEQAIDDAKKLNYGRLPFYLCRGVSGSSLVTPPAQTPALGGVGGTPFLRMC